MKMNYFLNTLFLLVAFGASVVGCKEPSCDISKGFGDREITFSSNISFTPLRAYDNTWEQGDLISVYMLKSGVLLGTSTAATDLYYNGVNYKAKTEGLKVNFEPATEADRMYFPSTHNVDFVAFYPTSLTPTSNRTIALDVAVNTVDLLYSNNAKGKNRNTTADELLLTFKHALSAIRVSLVDANDAAINNATVKIQGFKTKATFSLADGTLADVKEPTELALTLKNTSFDGIVLPQTIAANAAKILITHDGKNYKYTIPALSYEQGRRVSYKLKLQEKSVEAVINGEITDWEEIDGGNATLTPETPSTDVSSFSISKSNVTFTKAGGTEVLTVTTDAQSYTATSSDSWLTVTTDVAASTVTLTAPANSGVERTATVTLQHNGILRAAPQSLTVNVTQSGTGDTPQPQEWDGGIMQIRETFKSGVQTVANETTITGILINNPIGNMFSNKALILSDGKAGIMVFLSDKGLSASDGFETGDELQIVIPAGSTLSRYNDAALQVGNVPKTAITKVTKTHHVEPIEVTLADLMTDRIKDDLECRLIKIAGVQFRTPGGDFAVSKTTYRPIQEDVNSTAPEGFSLPSVGASRKQYNTIGITTIPSGNGTIIGATAVRSRSVEKNTVLECSIWIRYAADLQLNDPRK